MPEASGALGATVLGDGRCLFRVWAPRARRVEVVLEGDDGREEQLEACERGYFERELPEVQSGQLYRYRLDGELLRPDPASRSQPHGVHGPSEVVSLDFPWTDAAFQGIELTDHVFYELHVGTFTGEGTFDGVIAELARLRELGVTTLELMPVAQFPGARNWGYDGVFPFAAQHSYGGARGLQRLVDACHAEGLAVALDVVYNHLGPEGNYLGDYAPYFTDAHHTPWGQAMNVDQAGSDEVRRYFIDNALSWVEDFHVDALRLDAVHAIFDQAALPFLEELGGRVHELASRLGRQVHVIAESALNDPRLTRRPSRGGMGLDAAWSDDFHHALHVLLTGERDGYYVDFGRLQDLGDAIRDGQTFVGQYSRHRGRRQGRPCDDLEPQRFLVSAQNHDQVGNRMLGERLSALCDLEAQKLAAACTLLSPQLPLLFMGEEYGETAPFLYFVSHGDPDLVEAVRRGRSEEFASFSWRGEVPDPQALQTFERSRPDPGLRSREPHAQLEAFHRALIALRRELAPGPADVHVDEEARVLQLQSRQPDRAGARWVLLSFADGPRVLRAAAPAAGEWRLALSSSDAAWAGPGASLPASVSHAEGPVAITLPRHCCAAYVRG
ncbi:MAG: malto-oligosyltrehalose trehalohydrolase [Myxococcales bacterium]